MRRFGVLQRRRLGGFGVLSLGCSPEVGVDRLGDFPGAAVPCTQTESSPIAAFIA